MAANYHYQRIKMRVVINLFHINCLPTTTVKPIAKCSIPTFSPCKPGKKDNFYIFLQKNTFSTCNIPNMEYNNIRI